MSKIITEKNVKIKQLFITYNILFYYHNEDIKLIDYYLDNLKIMFEQLTNPNDTDIQFIINFIVSDLDNFITKLESHINITKFESSNNIYIKYMKHQLIL